MAELPLIDSSDLTKDQLAGLECVSCRKRFPRPVVPVGRAGTGDVLYRCPECVVVLEPADRGLVRVLSTRSDSERQA